MRIAAVVAVVALLAGCSATRVDVANMSAADLTSSPEFMSIYPSVPDGVKVIGPVASNICQVNKGDHAPSNADAIKALKVQAAQKGATALAQVTFGRTTTPTPNCVSSAYARGIAYVHG
jgi:hypothetical protein